MRRPFQVFGILLVFSLSGLSCRVFSPQPTTAPDVPASIPVRETVIAPVYLPPAADLVALEDTLVEVYEKVNPGVVTIRGLTEFGGAGGSGFVVDKEGHILTNYHVVEEISDLEVAFPSGLKVRGEVVGTDLDSDLAVVKVDVSPDDLSPLTLGDSEQVRVGQSVIAIGNPFGFNGTMTLGIISGLGRTMESLHEAPTGGVFSTGDIIQTDAAINPGNSGGPLLNLNGDVIGVNRAIFTNSFSNSGQPLNSGIGFAVSINVVKRVVPSLIAAGSYDYPYVGITSTGDDLSLLELEALGLPGAVGVYVTSVSPGSPAEKAGLRGGSSPTEFGLRAGGDLIIAIDGEVVRNFSDFLGYIIRHKSPGDVIQLTVLRGDQEIEIPVTLEKRPIP